MQARLVLIMRYLNSAKCEAGRRRGQPQRLHGQHIIDYGGIGFVQIDTGRIGGLSVAKQVADYAHARGVTYVNHTFTSHLALSASLQPYAGLKDDEICEYPVELKPLAVEITQTHLERNSDGYIHIPESPGLGMTVDLDALKKYLVDVEIRVGADLLYQTPSYLPNPDKPEPR